MALGAGYDAGIDFYVSPRIIKENSEGKQILAAIKKWETARLSNAFTEEEKAIMRDPGKRVQFDARARQVEDDVSEMEIARREANK